MKNILDYYSLLKPNSNWRKLLLTMKISAFLLFCFLVNIFAAPTYSQATKISLNLKDATIEEVLNKIEDVSEFYFLFNQKLINVTRKVNIEADKEPIKDILNDILNDDIKFIVYDRQIILTPSDVTSLSAAMQQLKITGTVTEKNGSPIPGVNVVVTGTTQGTMTDIAGKYSIVVPQGSKSLTFSFTGMESQEISIGSLTQINVTMTESIIGLEEIVVIGYGTQKKLNLTGAVSSMNVGNLKASPAFNLTTSIGGQITGIIANTRSGEPGADNAEIFIRGKGTLGTQTPLIVIDGVPDRDGGFSRLNPSDIATFTVLKDATAAVYGARAANGVILVTTKRGDKGKPTLSFTSNFGLSQPTRTPHMLNSYQFAVADNEYVQLTGTAKRWTDDDLQKFKDGSEPLSYPNTNWWHSIMREWAPFQNYMLSLSGGNEKIKYYVSGQYLDQEGDYRGGAAYFKQAQFRSNIDIAVTDNFNIGIDILYRHELMNSSVGGDIGGVFSNIWLAYPYLVDVYPNGYYGLGIGGGPGNELVVTSPAYGYSRLGTDYLQSKISFNWNLSKVAEGLSLDGYFSYDLINNMNKTFVKTPPPAYTYNASTDSYTQIISKSIPTISQSDGSNMKDLIYLKLGYTKQINLHSINAFVAYEQSYGYNESLSAGRQGFLSNSLDQMFAGSDLGMTNNSSAEEAARSNLISRISYNYKNKYLVDLSARYDGSQNFPKSKRFGFFPGVSAGWRISQESFFKSSVINELKLRGSWGKLGNDAVPAFQYIQTYNFSSTGYIFGNTASPYKSFILGPTPNPIITWEVATSTDLGLELQLFQGKIGFATDVFRSMRSNILVPRSESVPLYTGLTLPSENLGKVLNQGIELEASINGNNGKNGFSYRVKGNFTFVRNKVVFMDEPLNVPEYQKKTGYPIDSYLIYQSDGLFQTAQEVLDYPHLGGTGPGDIKYLDINGDKVINTLDQVRIFASRTPEIVYGTTFSCGYKNFDLSVFFQGQARAKGQLRPSGLNMIEDFFTDRWQKEGDNKYPRNFNGETGRSFGPNNNGSDFWLLDCSFLRLKNIELAYNIPKNILGKTFQGIRVYISANNVFSIDKYPSSIDPENPTDNGRNYYPIQRIVNAGLTITF